MRFIWRALVFTSLLGLSAAHAQTVGDVDKGHIYALQVCAACHAVDAGDATSPNPLSPPFEQLMRQPENSDMTLLIWLHTPHETMPDIKVESPDLENLFAYLDTLRPEE